MDVNVAQKATEYHICGFNCAQSVLSSLSEYTGADEHKSLAIASCFGGGARCGELCGAVSGALMAIGLYFPFNNEDDIQAKEKVSELAVKYTQSFINKFGYIRCFDLKEAYKENNNCSEIIESAAELAEEIILKNQ